MKILTAIDSFKGSFTSSEANSIVGSAFLNLSQEDEVTQVAIADGGEGTIDALISELDGKLLEINTVDLIGNPIVANIGWIESEKKAIIEVANSVGIQFLNGKKETHPNYTNSYGIGLLIKEVLDLGAREIIVALGGTGTIDIGWGLATALGAKSFDLYGNELLPIPQNFDKVSKLNFSGIDSRLKLTKLTLLSDVQNQLFGQNGVVKLFGLQKGLDPKEFVAYEAKAKRFANLVEPGGFNISGDGAAGGIGFMLRSKFGGEYQPGFEFMAKNLKIGDKIHSADLIITGEGRIDSQSLIGKVPVGIAKLSKSQGKPVVAFTGKNELLSVDYKSAGFDVVIPIVNRVMTLDQAINNGKKNLESASKLLVEILNLRI